MMKAPLLLWALCLLCCSCATSTVQPDDRLVGYDYFPLQEKSFVTYQVDELTYRLIEEPETLSYQLQYVVGESFVDAKGDSSRYYRRFRRETDTEPWLLDSVFTIRRTATLGIVNQNNLEQIKLVFPIGVGVSWNTNALNARAGETRNSSTIQYFDRAASLAGRSYPRTLRIGIALDTASLLGRDWEYETYASDIGLIERYYEHLEYDQADLGAQRIVVGKVYRAVAIAAGRQP